MHCGTTAPLGVAPVFQSFLSCNAPLAKILLVTSKKLAIRFPRVKDKQVASRFLAPLNRWDLGFFDLPFS
jgi:hypothetical protein